MPQAKLGIMIRALRLPFITASALPFTAGYLFADKPFSVIRFFLGLLAAVLTHLSANLINDYADSKSGADWKDHNHYGLFGGSKLIQEGVLSEAFYLKAAGIAFSGAFFCIITLSFVMQAPAVFVYFFSILVLSYFYSAKPLQLSYRRLGECVIFLLFGPALVMGGYYIQTRIFPSWDSFLLSVPFGLLTTTILFANEVPDLETDMASGKMTWVSLTGAARAYQMYYALMGLSLFAILGNIFLGNLSAWALLSFGLWVGVVKAANILKTEYANKGALVRASALTIQIQVFGNLILIGALLL